MGRIASRVIASSLLCTLAACATPGSGTPAGSPTAAADPVAKPETPAQPEIPAKPETPPKPEQPEPPAQPETPPPKVEETPPPGFEPIPAKRKKGFPGVAFTEVRAFAFDLEVADRPVCGMPLDPDGTPCETVAQPGVVLSDAQTKLLLSMLSKKSTWGSGSSCFLPHHGFVFYDEAGTPVAELSLCFMCQMLVAAPAIPGAKRLGGDDTYGLSEKSTEQFRVLCRELGLPKCDARNPTEFAEAPPQ